MQPEHGSPLLSTYRMAAGAGFRDFAAFDGGLRQADRDDVPGVVQDRPHVAASLETWMPGSERPAHGGGDALDESSSRFTSTCERRRAVLPKVTVWDRGLWR